LSKNKRELKLLVDDDDNDDDIIIKTANLWAVTGSNNNLEIKLPFEHNIQL
jgi:hypothetical protein